MNTIVVPDPRPVPAPAIAGGVFAFDSSFPNPGITAFIHDLPSVVVPSSGRRIGVFGHTDAVGSVDYNKGLGDRRAQAVMALLQTDVVRFESVHVAEAWGEAEHQAMLRALGCDPGPPDGEPGAMTRAAVRAFQRGYGRGVWFESYQQPRYGELEVTGELDEATCAAIRDAYVNYLGQDLAAAKLVPDRAFGGCGELNPIRADADEQRRVTLAIFGPGEPESPLPCVEGDASACQVGGEGVRTCRWYREHVEEPEEPAPVRAFLDDHWMPTPSGRAYMSALCSLPDDTAVTFTVHRTRGDIPRLYRCSFDEDAKPNGLETIATVEGAVRCGVAFGVWEPDGDVLPFDTRTWYDHGEEEEADGLALADLVRRFRERVRYRPPVFEVEGDGQWLVSRPPNRRLRGLVVEGGAAQGLVMLPDGTFAAVGTGEGVHRSEAAVYAGFGRPMRPDSGHEGGGGE